MPLETSVSGGFCSWAAKARKWKIISSAEWKWQQREVLPFRTIKRDERVSHRDILCLAPVYDAAKWLRCYPLLLLKLLQPVTTHYGSSVASAQSMREKECKLKRLDGLKALTHHDILTQYTTSPVRLKVSWICIKETADTLPGPP